MNDIKGKIRKLLALATSPNENEAKSALLRARQLMAKHKLREADCVEVPKEVAKTITDWTATKRSDPWMITLAGVIAGHYCCEPFTNSKKGKRTYNIGFVGFPDDLEVCVEVYGYAIGFVKRQNADRKARLKGIFNADAIRAECITYGIGFAQGLQNAYDKQERETLAGEEAESGNAESNRESWGLVMSVPKEVSDFLTSLTQGTKAKTWNATYNASSGAFADGYQAGQGFGDKKALKEATA